MDHGIYLLNYKASNQRISIAVPIDKLMSYVASNRSQDLSKGLELALTLERFMARVIGQPSVLKLSQLTDKFVINHEGVVRPKVVIDRPCSAKEIAKRII